MTNLCVLTVKNSHAFGVLVGREARNVSAGA